MAGPRMIETDSSTLQNSLFEMTLTCLSIILTKSLEGVFPTMWLGVSFHYVITKHVGGILVGERQ